MFRTVSDSGASPAGSSWANLAQLGRPAAPQVEPRQASAESPLRSFRPKLQATIQETGLTDVLVEGLVFKTLLANGNMTSREVARATALPGKPILDLLASLKMRQLAHYKDSAEMGDFVYSLTDAGRVRASGYMSECSYVGPAPVPLDAYCASVDAQGITTMRPKQQDLERAFGDLVIDQRMFDRLGPAINSGRGLFLYGFPGNGKTSIAERITDCFGDEVRIPYAIAVAGQLITLYDTQTHHRADLTETSKDDIVDPRWVRIRRPTIAVGGELTLDALELCYNQGTGITEASLQLKTNTGTLVIDDFGRQRMRPLELLNRWIIPLEKRYDFLSLSNGKKIKVPFNQLIIFSTNLEPRDLVDEAFLRRIPYKINVTNPTEDNFRELFELMAPILGVEISDGAVDYLIRTHYQATNRPFRACQPRDLLQQVADDASYKGDRAVATPESFDRAVENYFTVM